MTKRYYRCLHRKSLRIKKKKKSLPSTGNICKWCTTQPRSKIVWQAKWHILTICGLGHHKTDVVCCLPFINLFQAQSALATLDTSFTALSGIYLLIFTMLEVLSWKYGWTTLGGKIIHNFLVNIVNFLKNNNFKSKADLFLGSIHFVIGPISYQRNNFKTLDVYILVKRPPKKLHLHPQWGPDTHNSTHHRGAASKAEQPLFVQKNHL